MSDEFAAAASFPCEETSFESGIRRCWRCTLCSPFLRVRLSGAPRAGRKIGRRQRDLSVYGILQGIQRGLTNTGERSIQLQASKDEAWNRFDVPVTSYPSDSVFKRNLSGRPESKTCARCCWPDPIDPLRRRGGSGNVSRGPQNNRMVPRRLFPSNRTAELSSRIRLCRK